MTKRSTLYERLASLEKVLYLPARSRKAIVSCRPSVMDGSQGSGASEMCSMNVFLFVLFSAFSEFVDRQHQVESFVRHLCASYFRSFHFEVRPRRSLISSLRGESFPSMHYAELSESLFSLYVFHLRFYVIIQSAETFDELIV